MLLLARYRIIGIALWVAALLAAASPAAGVVAGDPCGLSNFVAGRGQQLTPFERAVPVAPTSMAIRYAELETWVRSKVKETPDGSRVVNQFTDGGRRPVKLADVMAALVATRNRLADELSAKAATLEGAPDAASALRSSAERFRFDEKSAQGDYYRNKDWQTYLDDVREAGRQDYNRDDPRHWELLNRTGGILAGEWGELKVAMLVSKLRTRGLLVRNLTGAYRLPVNLRDKEIDLVFDLADGATAWGEVKNFKRPLGVDSSQWAKVLSQQRATADVIRLLGLEVERHIFLLGGVTVEAKRLLEAEGIYVHAQVVS
jgi:hypothetical protein